MSPENQRELNHSEKVGGMALPAAADTAVVPQPGKPAAKLSNKSGMPHIAVDMPQRGHFAAAEEPELLAEEIRTFFRGTRK
jgi:hypothetical protein